jgi:hypothetical protein
MQGVIQLHHPPGSIQEGSEEGNRVQRGGHEESFIGQCALGLLLSPQGPLLGGHAGVQFQPRYHLTSQNLKEVDVLLAESALLPRQDRQRADDMPAGGQERYSCVGAASTCADHRNPCGRKARILPSIVDQQRLTLLQHPLAGG